MPHFPYLREIQNFSLIDLRFAYKRHLSIWIKQEYLPFLLASRKALALDLE